MICRWATYLTVLEVIECKICMAEYVWQNMYAKKSFFMVFAWSYDYYENQNNHKGNDCKV